MRKLRKLVEGLEWKTPKTAWTEYDDNNRGYTEPDLDAKRAFVERPPSGSSRRWRGTSGANDGLRPPRRAARREVVAMDFDHETVEHMYRARSTRDEHPPAGRRPLRPEPRARLGPGRARPAAARAGGPT